MGSNIQIGPQTLKLQLDLSKTLLYENIPSLTVTMNRTMLGLQLYTSFHLASRGTTRYIISGLIPSGRKGHLHLKKPFLILFPQNC